jgi:putative acetyltransferase
MDKIKHMLLIVLTVVTCLNRFIAGNEKENILFQNVNNEIQYIIRKAKIIDSDKLKCLYKKVAAIPGGLARSIEEITDEYINKVLISGINFGLALVVEYNDKLIGSIIKYKLQPKVFAHILSEGSIIVDPAFQGKGIGSKLILTFLSEIQKNHAETLRVEIIARESNPAIKLYEKLGFKKEGRFEKRIIGVNGVLEADIPMAWFNPNYKP